MECISYNAFKMQIEDNVMSENEELSRKLSSENISEASDVEMSQSMEKTVYHYICPMCGSYRIKYGIYYNMVCEDCGYSAQSSDFHHL